MLTNDQLTTLAADIEADSTLAEIPKTADGAFEVAAAYNQIASPGFTVWKTDVTTEDIRAVVVWAEYDILSVSKQNAFEFLCSNHVVNGALSNVRQGIQSIFSSPQQSGNLAAMIAIAKRLAKRAEKLFATGTGTNGSPATMTFEGDLTFRDVLDAWETA